MARQVQGCASINGSVFTVARFQGKLAEIKQYTVASEKAPITVKRGIVNGFTPSARLRFLRFVATINWEKYMQCLFITLTYPDERADRDTRSRNKDRARFWRFVEDHEKRHVPGIWRCEWKMRRSGEYKGMLVPHFHLLAFGVEYIPHQFVRDWWRSIIHVKGSLATDVKRVSNGAKASVYIGKYMSKAGDVDSLDYDAYLNFPGRHYGYFRKPQIERCVVEMLTELSPQQLEALYAYANDALPWLNKEHKTSFCLLGSHVDLAREIIRQGGLPRDPEL